MNIIHVDYSNNRQVEELTQLVTEMKLTVDGLEKERDFYFGKLRDIEVLAQKPEYENSDFVKGLLEILYATEVLNHGVIYLSVHTYCI